VIDRADLPAVRQAIAEVRRSYGEILQAQPRLSPWCAFQEAKARCAPAMERAATQLDLAEALSAAGQVLASPPPARQAAPVAPPATMPRAAGPDRR
jgi:hypothetical protein